MILELFMGSTDRSGFVAGLGKKSMVNRFEPGESMNLDEAVFFYGNNEAGNLSAIRELDRYHEIVNDARVKEHMYEIVSDARVKEHMYAVRNFSDGKDVQRIDGIRVSADCSRESKDRYFDMLETEDHAGTFLNDGKEVIIFDGKDRYFDMLEAEDHAETFLNDDKEVVIFDRDSELDDRSNLAGMIFMCNKKTKKDCFRHSLFGLPFNSWNLVRQVVPGTILFLFEYEARQMWGIYEAVSHGKININASAYSHSKGSFPAQVRVREIETFPALEEREFKEAIKDNYFSDMKFEFALSLDQVRRLSKVFLQKSASRCMSRLDHEVIHVDHYSGKVKETRDCIERSDEMHDFQSPMAEEYIPIESIQRENKFFNEGQLHGSMSDYGNSGQLHRALLEYHHSYSDRSDKVPLRAKIDDVPCLEKENDFLLKTRMYDFAEGPFSGGFLNSVSENNRDEFHGIAKCLMYSPNNSEVYFLSGSNAEASSLVNDRSRPLVGIHHACEYPPSIEDLTQPIYEHMLGEERRNMLPTGLESDVGEKNFELTYADRSKHKSSVWSRLSGRDNISLRSFGNRNTGNGWLNSSKHTAMPSTQDRLEKFVTCEQKAFNGQNMIDRILEEPVVYDQPRMLINFKRRKNVRDVCISQELEKTREKKRRKLIRPDFSDLSESQDKGKDAISTYIMEPQRKKQPDLIQDKMTNSKIVEDEEHAKYLHSGVIVKQQLEFGQRSNESEPSVSFKPSKRGVDLNGWNRNKCKELDSNGDLQPGSNNQLAGVCSGGDLLAEKGNQFRSERGTPLQMEAGICGDVCTRQTANIDDQRVSDHEVTGGEILTTESLVNSNSQRAVGNSVKLICETNIGSDVDMPIASREAASEKNGRCLIDLNEPQCPIDSKNKDEYVHSLVGDSNSCHNQNSSISIDGHDNQNSPPCLCLELKMVPNGLISAISAEVTTGETSGQHLESCQT